MFCTIATSGSKGNQGNLTNGAYTKGPSTNTSGSTAITIAQMPSHSHVLQANYTIDSNHAHHGHDDKVATGIKSPTGTASPPTLSNTGGGAGHTHTLSSHTHPIPYTQVYVWKRTA